MLTEKERNAAESQPAKAAIALRGGVVELPVEPPAFLPDPDLSENAVSVLERRYLVKDDELRPVETPRELFWRVARAIAAVDLMYGATTKEALKTAERFYHLLATGLFEPNSPTLMNAGRPLGQLSACFVLPVEDSLAGIYTTLRNMALIHQSGGGTGFGFSRLRPSGDVVRSTMGVASGPVSFMEVYDASTEAVKQGGTRRGANMGILRVDHPDIREFIHCKRDNQRVTNFNISVAVTDAFMRAVEADEEYELISPRSGVVVDRLGAREVFAEIVEGAWRNGEPGVFFVDRANYYNPVPRLGSYEATNPCGEQPLLPFDVCNLGSVNLGAFVEEGTINWDRLRETVHQSTHFLDNVIDANRYPLPEITELAQRIRRIGLGVMGWADMLVRLGIAYGSEESFELAERVMRFIDEESKIKSEQLAAERGVFPEWERSIWGPDESCARDRAGKRVRAERPLRNCNLTTVAPTGTISIIAGCSGGIEPMFSLAFIRQVMKDTRGVPTILRETNYVFEQVARQGGFYTEELIDQIIEDGTIAHNDDVPEDVQRVFVTAHDITPYWHMRMQAAFQQHCDSSISKTINFQREATVDDVREIYELAIDLDVKGVTVYRDGCRDMQPMALKKSKRSQVDAQVDEAVGEEELASPLTAELAPVRLPEIMPSLRIRQMTPFGNMHVKVSVDPVAGREREVFAQLGKGGDVANSDLEAICRILSLWLRANGSLSTALKQLGGIGSSLTVPTKDGRIMSLPDGLARALNRYLAAKEKHGLEALLLGRVDPRELNFDPSETSTAGAPQNVSKYKLKCPQCTLTLAFEEGCVKCYSCGYSQC